MFRICYIVKVYLIEVFFDVLTQTAPLRPKNFERRKSEGET